METSRLESLSQIWRNCRQINTRFRLQWNWSQPSHFNFEPRKRIYTNLWPSFPKLLEENKKTYALFMYCISLLSIGKENRPQFTGGIHTKSFSPSMILQRGAKGSYIMCICLKWSFQHNTCRRFSDCQPALNGYYRRPHFTAGDIPAPIILAPPITTN